jgi:hypothetical protein
MENLIWFHLECPKVASEFDDPVKFRLKWRDYFGQLKAIEQKKN